jgi:maltose/moltooligosaccharide transporter
MDYGCINVSMEPFRAFVGDNLPENNVPWDLPCKVFLLGLVLASKLPLIFTYLELTIQLLLVLFLTQLNTPLFWWNRIYCNCTLTVITSKEYSRRISRHKETSLIKETHSADWFASNGKSHLMKGICF